jgi:alpha-ketoglutarate-dependent taurine dioxygenase
MTHQVHLWRSLPHLSEVTYSFTKDWANDQLSRISDRHELLSDPNNVIPDQSDLPRFETISSALRTNPGFVLIRPGSDYQDDDLRQLYALFGRSIGQINDRYGYFFDVIDQGLDYTKAAIPVSKTKASTGYHTDSTAKEYVPDVVGLLCLHPGFRGGESLITNAANAYELIRRDNPKSLDELEKPVIRDVITPGSENSTAAILENTFPVFQVNEDGFLFRYMRYWIESAHAKTSKELPVYLKQGMDTIDEFFSREDSTVEFRMERGDMLFLNNRFLCHNRRAFEDHPAMPSRRLVRSWINFENG